MNTRTPAMLIYAAAITSAALLGACNKNRDVDDRRSSAGPNPPTPATPVNEEYSADVNARPVDAGTRHDTAGSSSYAGREVQWNSSTGHSDTTPQPELRQDWAFENEGPGTDVENPAAPTSRDMDEQYGRTQDRDAIAVSDGRDSDWRSNDVNARWSERSGDDSVIKNPDPPTPAVPTRPQFKFNNTGSDSYRPSAMRTQSDASSDRIARSERTDTRSTAAAARTQDRDRRDSDWRNDDVNARWSEPARGDGVTKNPDPPTLAVPTRPQFKFDNTGSGSAMGTTRGDADRIATADQRTETLNRTTTTEADDWSREHTVAQSDTLDADTQQTSGTAIAGTMGPNPTAPGQVEGTAATGVNDGAYVATGATGAQAGDDRWISDDVNARPDWNDSRARSTMYGSAATHKEPDAPTPARPTREHFIFDNKSEWKSASTDSDYRAMDSRWSDRRTADTEDDLWTSDEVNARPNAAASGSEARTMKDGEVCEPGEKAGKKEMKKEAKKEKKGWVSDDVNARRNEWNGSSPAVGPNPPTPATPVREEFEFDNGSTQVSQSAVRSGQHVEIRDDRWTSYDRNGSDDINARPNFEESETTATSGTAATGMTQSWYTSGGEVYAVSPEARVLSILHAKNQTEIEAGRLAMERGSSEEVREYGRMLVEHHTEADEQVVQAANDAGYSLMSREQVREMMAREKFKDDRADPISKLSGLRGRAFDEAFASEMEKGHSKLIKTLRDSAPTVREDVRALIEQMLPTLEEHQVEAMKLTARP